MDNQKKYIYKAPVVKIVGIKAQAIICGSDTPANLSSHTEGTYEEDLY